MAIIGPNYIRPESFHINLSGTKLSLSTPPHSHPRTPPFKRTARDVNIYDTDNFFEHPNTKKGSSKHCELLLSVWSFYERKLFLFTSDAGKSYCHIDVFHLPEFKTLFQTENIEQAINRLIFCYGGAYTKSGMCRLNWRVESFNNTQWIVFENDGHYSSGGVFNPCKSVIQTFYLTPISDEHVLCMYFTQVTRKEVNGLDDAFAKLRNTVMSSTEVHLSEDASRQKKEIEEAYPDQKYSENMPPYEFELMKYPDEQEIMRDYVDQKGADYINSLSEKKFSDTIDSLVEEKKQKRSSQINNILESHLRFKNSK